jgi:site-specific DNA recombinase
LPSSARGFTEELNHLRREQRAKLAAVSREIGSIDHRIAEILKLLLDGFRAEAFKDELRRLEDRKAELAASLAAAKSDPPLPALHPAMAEAFRKKTTMLAAALEHDEEHDLARQELRGFIDHIVIPPGDGLLQVVGNLGEMLTAAGGRNNSLAASVGYVGCGGGI